MVDIIQEINVLNDVLDKKLSVLSEILSITENENMLITQVSSNMVTQATLKELTPEFISEKQRRIDQVIVLDETFNTVYNTIKTALPNNTRLYKTQLVLIKSKIRAVTDYYVKIKLLEEKNSLLIKNRKLKKNEIKFPKLNRIEKYKSFVKK